MKIYMDMICRSISNNIYSRCVYIYAFLLIFVFISCEKNNPRAVREIKEMMGGMGINSIEALKGNRLMLRGIGMTDRELDILGIFHAGE